MKKRLLVLGALLLVAGYFLGRVGSREVHAQTHVSIPRSWGRCIGSLSKSGGAAGLLFEDSNGVVRLVDLGSGNAILVFDRQ
jgi:hypothetical protein